LELHRKGRKAEYTACHKREDGVGTIGDIIYAKPFANDNVRRVANEEDHASCIRGGELRKKPSRRVELHGVCVIHQEGRARKNNGVVPYNHTKKGEHEIESKEEFPSTGAAFVADPKRGCLEYSSDI
jgi:hypothetical protein